MTFIYGTITSTASKYISNSRGAVVASSWDATGTWVGEDEEACLLARSRARKTASNVMSPSFFEELLKQQPYPDHAVTDTHAQEVGRIEGRVAPFVFSI